MSGLEDYVGKIIEGDCLAVLPGIPDGSIDMILTDLPYGTTGIVWDIVIDLNQLWKQYERIIKANGVIALSSQGIFTGKLMLSNEKLFKYKLVWVKSSPTNFLNAKKAPLRRHEDILIFYKEQPTYNPQFQRGRVYVRGPKPETYNDNYGKVNAVGETTRSRDRYPNDVLFYEELEEDLPDSLYFKNAAAEGRTFHPTQKPEGLARYLIRTFTDPGQIVLDSTCGSGTFLVAAALRKMTFPCIRGNQWIISRFASTGWKRHTGGGKTKTKN
jgi:DNA modification methylase